MCWRALGVAAAVNVIAEPERDGHLENRKRAFKVFSADIEKPISELIQVVKGGAPSKQGITYHVFNGTPVGQRLADGYWEATAMCRAYGKLMGNYLKLKDKQEFLVALAADIPIGISELIQVVKGGDPTNQGSGAPPVEVLQQLVSPHKPSPPSAFGLGEWHDERGATTSAPAWSG